MRNPKADILEGLLSEYRVVKVCLHSRKHDETCLPSHLNNRDSIVLELGLNLPVPIPDLYIGDGGFRATLSFDRRPFEVTVLWDAVFMFVVDGDGGVVFDEARARAAGIAFEEDEPTAVRRRSLPPGWAVIEGGRADAPPKGAA
jgi:hypothetical protein